MQSEIVREDCVRRNVCRCSIPIQPDHDVVMGRG